MPRFEIPLDVQPIVSRLARLHRWILRLVQVSMFVVAGICAFLLRFDFSIPRRFQQHLAYALCAWVLSKILVFHFLGLDRGWWRYVSIPDLLRLAAGNVFGSALGGLVLIFVAPSGFPRSLYSLDFLLCFLLTSLARIAGRTLAEFSRLQRSHASKRTLIYGAGNAGVSLLNEVLQNPALAYEVVGFVDDNRAKVGSLIHRAKVLGEGAALPSLVKAHSIEMVLIALPSATGAQMTGVLGHCQTAGVPYKTIPSLAEIIKSSGLAMQIRDVSVEDLLGRHPVCLEESAIREKLEHQVVMVTGAAGSIGSELCRQIARFRPRAIVGFEIAETALFHIEGEMRRVFPEVPFHAEIGSIQNPRRLAEVIERHSPSILYHAAAYKHVPLMEDHLFEAVENNIFGTWNVALAASQYGVSDFVLISSDKAVRPANIMGVTKRISELLIHGLQNGYGRFVSVRFGNVLGSNGSVIPIFKSQIARGGPITLTHSEMRRYFMTIPEAVQLVLQASSMGTGGELFVLDMGQPVRILDLARNLILLSGLRPDQDIRIEYTGVRPGEKLFEELSTMDEQTLPTGHEKIRIFAGNGLPPDGMERHLEALRQCCEERDARSLILRFKEIVPEYNPSGHILRQLLEPEQSSRRMAAYI